MERRVEGLIEYDDDDTLVGVVVERWAPHLHSALERLRNNRPTESDLEDLQDAVANVMMTQAMPFGELDERGVRLDSLIDYLQPWKWPKSSASFPDLPG